MKTVLILAALLTSLPALGQHVHPTGPTPEAAPMAQRPVSRPWTTQPLLLPGRAARGERSAATLQPQGIAAANITVFAAEGPADRRKLDYPVEAAGARFASVTPQIGNYHWVVAREEHPDEVRVASTAWYFGNPGDSPKDLLKESRHELEIVPAPLPREHGSYRESEKWSFLVRFNGHPLPKHAVRLETEFGSRSAFLTDATGHATVLFPRDFRPPEGKTEGHGPRRAKFVLSAEKEDNGRKYLTAFNYVYGQDADRDRSIGWGAAFGLIGMIAATPLLRQRKASAGGDHA